MSATIQRMIALILLSLIANSGSIEFTFPFHCAVSYRPCYFVSRGYTHNMLVSLLTHLGTSLLLELCLQVGHRALDLLVGECLVAVLEDEAQGV